MKKKWNLSDVAAIVFLTLFSLYQIKAVFVGYWFTSHDGIFHLLRAEEFLKMLKAGFFPVRWGLNLDNGYGVPIFNYVYPGPYYLSSLLQIVGFSSRLAIKLLFALGYVLGGIGFYILLKKRGRWGAILGAMIYLLLPYQFLDIFVRGALGEVLVMGLAPWIWLVAEELGQRKMRWYDAIPLFVALICHNFLGPILLFLVLSYLVVCQKVVREQIKLVLFGFGLAAFFLVPMIVEKNLVVSGYRSTYTFNYRDHFVEIKQLIYSKWDYWYSIAGPGDGMSFQLGFASILILAGGIMAAATLFRWQNRRLNFWLFVYLFCGFLMTRYSIWVWQTVGLLQPLQFPWRFLAITTFVTPLILGEVLESGWRQKRRVGLLLGTILLCLAFYNSRNYKRPLLAKDEVGFGSLKAQYVKGTDTALRSEVAPKWSVANPYKTSDLELMSGSGAAEEVRRTSKGLEFTINSVGVSKFRANFNYFPAWKLRCKDCQGRVRIEAGKDGEIDFGPEPGRHSYSLKLESTLIEKVSNLVSVLVFLGLTGLLVRV